MPRVSAKGEAQGGGGGGVGLQLIKCMCACGTDGMWRLCYLFWCVLTALLRDSLNPHPNSHSTLIQPSPSPHLLCDTQHSLSPVLSTLTCSKPPAATHPRPSAPSSYPHPSTPSSPPLCALIPSAPRGRPAPCYSFNLCPCPCR